MRNNLFPFNYAFLIFSILFPFFCFTALGQTSTTELVKKLTDHKREWILDSTAVTLGTKCKNGEQLIFLNTNTVMYRYCDNGQWRSINKRWTILKVGEDWKIWIGDQQYLLVLGKKGKKDRMVLRTLGANRNDLTIDRIFFSEEE